jgi:hypothetical protein
MTDGSPETEARALCAALYPSDTLWLSLHKGTYRVLRGSTRHWHSTPGQGTNEMAAWEDAANELKREARSRLEYARREQTRYAAVVTRLSCLIEKKEPRR